MGDNSCTILYLFSNSKGDTRTAKCDRRFYTSLAYTVTQNLEPGTASYKLYRFNHQVGGFIKSCTVVQIRRQCANVFIRIIC